jgi:hypothetical protein
MYCIHLNSFDFRSASGEIDARFIAVVRGLDQLSCDGLRRILAFQNSNEGIVYDGGNFDAETRRWCPLGIGLGLADEHNTTSRSITTDAEAKVLIVTEGRQLYPDFHLNPISGINGRFYSSNRASDLRLACETILSVRGRCGLTAMADRPTEPTVNAVSAL